MKPKIGHLLFNKTISILIWATTRKIHKNLLVLGIKEFESPQDYFYRNWVDDMYALDTFSEKLEFARLLFNEADGLNSELRVIKS